MIVTVVPMASLVLVALESLILPQAVIVDSGKAKAIPAPVAIFIKERRFIFLLYILIPFLLFLIKLSGY